MAKIAFLMPLYPPHYDYARKFLHSFKKHRMDKQADMWFVFSNNDDRTAFPEAQNSIVLPAHLQHLGRENGIINVKKFYGLLRIKDRYDYVIVVDAEMLVFRDVNLLKICDNFFEKKVLWGYPKSVDDNIFSLIGKPCREFFAEKGKICDRGLNYWFNNLCLYKTDNLDDFFSKTGIPNKLENLNFWSFDHYIYMYYLLLYQNFRGESIVPTDGFAESKESIVNKKYKCKYMHMSTKEMYCQIKKLGGGKGCFMFIHLDRKPPPTGRPSIIRVIRRLVSCFVPVKKWRKKIRG